MGLYSQRHLFWGSIFGGSFGLVGSYLGVYGIRRKYSMWGHARLGTAKHISD